jgi:predicted dehydrogenase
LGTGNIANQFAKGLYVVPGAVLQAVGSRSQEKASRFAQTYAIPNAHPSYEALAADPCVDIVYVATPHVFHREQSLLCLRQGKAVLCEKPFALNLDETQEVLNLARQERRFVMEAVWSRFLPHMEKALSLVREGAIGEVTMLQANFGFRVPFNPKSRLFDPALGGGALLDVGIYPVYLAYWLLGLPEQIRSTVHLGATGVDERAGILFSYANGAIATLNFSIRNRLPDTAVISGRRGEIHLHERWWAPEGQFTLHQADGKPERFRFDTAGNGYNYEAIEAMNALRQGKLESDKLPWQATRAVHGMLSSIRQEWGLLYPSEIE